MEYIRPTHKETFNMVHEHHEFGILYSLIFICGVWASDNFTFNFF